MSESVKGRFETKTTEAAEKFDKQFTKPIIGSNVSISNILVGAGLIAATIGASGNGVNGPANNMLMAYCGTALAGGSMKDAAGHSMIYHLAVKSARQVDNIASRLENADMKTKFNAARKNLMSKANIIMNQARAKAVIGREKLKNAAQNQIASKDIPMDIFTGKENAQGTNQLLKVATIGRAKGGMSK